MEGVQVTAISLLSIRLFNRPTDQIWTSNLIGRVPSRHQSNLSDCDLDYLDESIQSLHDDEDAQSTGRKQW
jgi:hypothetical protein